MRNKEAIDDGQEQRNDKLKDVEEEDRRMKADRDERIHGTIGHEEPPSELRSDESLRWNISAQKDINEAKKYHVTINNIITKERILEKSVQINRLFQSLSNQRLTRTNRCLSTDLRRAQPLPLETDATRCLSRDCSNDPIVNERTDFAKSGQGTGSCLALALQQRQPQ